MVGVLVWKDYVRVLPGQARCLCHFWNEIKDVEGDYKGPQKREREKNLLTIINGKLMNSIRT